MILTRLDVRRKLNLLIALPLIATIVISVPFTIGRVEDTMSASSTVRVADQARGIAMLIQELQKERLFTLTYLVSNDTDRESVRLAISHVSDRTENIVSQLQRPRDNVLFSAISKIQTLDLIRQASLKKVGDPAQVDLAYHELVMRLISALSLTHNREVDTTGNRQLATLDALLRINEDITRLGAALVIGTTDASAASRLIVENLITVASHILHFHQQADDNQSALLSNVIQGQTAQRMNEYARQITAGGLWVTATKALTVAESALTLTRILQDYLAQDITRRANSRASSAQTSASIVLGFTLSLIVAVLLLSTAVSSSIARPLRRLTVAASSVANLAKRELVRVADSERELTRPPKLSAVQISAAGEIEELAAAFNQVQATAALLMEQQVATRRNVAVMFANVARRTRSLVARQLNSIDDLERGEQDREALSKLYKLDHLTARLHRSADSLLVLAGDREGDEIAGPAPLADIVRSAISEIEGYQSVEIGLIYSANIAPELVSDLRLLLAELLENATAFTPPESSVTVSATLEEDIQILIVDRGIGMSDERLAEENQRLVERERLEIAPTSMLGLFVVGRLARRHGLRVWLEHNTGQGITARIRIPPQLFSIQNRIVPLSISGTMKYPDDHTAMLLSKNSSSGIGQHQSTLLELPSAEGSFEWFVTPPSPSPEPSPEPSPVSPPSEWVSSAAPPPAGYPIHPVYSSPSTSSQQDWGFHGPPEQPVPPSTSTIPSSPQSTGPSQRGGLTRRVPGAQLFPSLRPSPSLSQVTVPIRSAEEEREAIMGFLDGVARAELQNNNFSPNNACNKSE